MTRLFISTMLEQPQPQRCESPLCIEKTEEDEG